MFEIVSQSLIIAPTVHHVAECPRAACRRGRVLCVVWRLCVTCRACVPRDFFSLALLCLWFAVFAVLGAALAPRGVVEGVMMHPTLFLPKPLHTYKPLCEYSMF